MKAPIVVVVKSEKKAHTHLIIIPLIYHLIL